MSWYHEYKYSVDMKKRKRLLKPTLFSGKHEKVTKWVKVAGQFDSCITDKWLLN